MEQTRITRTSIAMAMTAIIVLIHTIIVLSIPTWIGWMSVIVMTYVYYKWYMIITKYLFGEE